MSITVEINVLSSENLRIDRRPVKKNTYVVLSTNPFNSHATTVDTDGGSHPSWHHKLIMDMSPNKERFISLEVRCKRSSNGGSYKLVGMASIPVSDFFGGYLPLNYLNFLSYRLRDKEGYRNGIINVSLRVVKAAEEYLPMTKLVVESRTSNISPHQQSRPLWGGAVTGIPVNWVKS